MKKQEWDGEEVWVKPVHTDPREKRRRGRGLIVFVESHKV